MPFGRKGPTITGADFLILMADDAMKSGMPYADQFRHMVMRTFDMQEATSLETKTVAQRPLTEHEAAPVTIIAAALEAAAERGDKESQAEVLRVGLLLLAKWPEYLTTLPRGHPTLLRQ